MRCEHDVTKNGCFDCLRNERDLLFDALARTQANLEALRKTYEKSQEY